MSTLLVQADGVGLLGPAAVQPLAHLFAALQGDMAQDAQRFAAFYHFVFFVARERGHRNLSYHTATESWRFLLGGGRFGLLAPWCEFVAKRADTSTKGISEDTWCQVRDRVAAGFRSVSLGRPFASLPLDRMACLLSFFFVPAPAPTMKLWHHRMLWHGALFRALPVQLLAPCNYRRTASSDTPGARASSPAHRRDDLLQPRDDLLQPRTPNTDSFPVSSISPPLSFCAPCYTITFTAPDG